MQTGIQERVEFTQDTNERRNARHEPALPQPKAPVQSKTNVGNVERMLSTALGGALLLGAVRRPTLSRAAFVLGGSAFLHRGLTGHCYMYQAIGRNTAKAGQRAAVQRTLTIGKSADELYQAWLDPEHIASIVKPFARVVDQGGGRLRWTVSLSKKRELSWVTRVVMQEPGELVAWRTEVDAPFSHEGSVSFHKAPNDLGTEVTLCMSFGSEQDVLGRALRALTSQWLRTLPSALEESILRRCKSLCETGEIPTLEHNPAARKPRSTPLLPARSLS